MLRVACLYRFRRFVPIAWVILLCSCSGWLNNESKTSPDPQEVLGVLRNFPNATSKREEAQLGAVDSSVIITFNVITTSDVAIEYYDPLLAALGLRKHPSKAPVDNEPPVDQAWSAGRVCPYHYVTLTTTSETLIITYGYGVCR